jgi:hypothetical protein
MKKNKSSETSNASLPLFYKDPHPIMLSEHQGMRLRKRSNYTFAKKTNSIPVVMSEFRSAARIYPIVFSVGEFCSALIVTGATQGENTFIDQDGQWMANAYIPSYVHRYPFIFMEDEASKQYILSLDIASDQIDNQGELALFEDKKPSAYVDTMMKFVTEYQTGLQATHEFVKALQDHELLVSATADLHLGTHNKDLKVGGFYMISEEAYHKLPEKVIIDWHKNGWMYLIHAHFISTENWKSLANYTDESYALSASA